MDQWFEKGERIPMRKIVFLGLVTAALATAPFASAQQPPAAPFQTHQIAPNVYYVEGGGGNTGVVVGEKGVILIDAKTTADSGKQFADAVAKITPKPITAIILTHSDGDHVGGLVAFPKGLTIIAQEGNKKEQEAAIAAGPRGPSPDYLPTRVVTKPKEDLTIDGVKFELMHWAPAHTSGDLIVFLPAQKIVFAGDIITTNRFQPLIHAEKNGSSEGWIVTVKGMVALNADQFVSGHGDVLKKDAVQEKLDKATAERDKIKELVAKGQTLEQVETLVGDPPPSEMQGGGGPRFAPYSEVVYNELTKK
jgi:glyoxylase-like metal-dependent hydrolase (beta-lactamase superfamily II)